MAITGLVVSIAGLSYNILSKQFYSYKEMNSSMASAYLLNNRLGEDFLGSVSLHKNDNELLILRTSGKEIRYIFNENSIIRDEASIRDTFFISAIDIRSSFLIEEREAGLVDELYFRAKVLDEEEIFHYSKQYGADVMLKEKEEQDGH